MKQSEMCSFFGTGAGPGGEPKRLKFSIFANHEVWVENETNDKNYVVEDMDLSIDHRGV